ncbi:lipoprotein LpqH [Actinophytocola gossypii]|uniref:Lipoprotein LpqH n=1 Tax=Actinophytocola gossypii TaxID=2812003 RepID=A0ABT2J3N6_9PSEU|nr:lipoprotein LpqH [Actinophytocola gossypii]MCT2582455.1 lipoprotein LpqH [Actinophytocola gossypii]
MRRSVAGVVGVGAALLLAVSGCSDDTSADPVGQVTETTDEPAVTTIELTVGGEPVELTDSVSTCYDHEGHLMVEAYNADDPDASHFLMDHYQDTVSLSIGVRDGELFRYEEGANGQTAEVSRDGNSVTVDGTIGVSGDSSEPRAFTIDAECAEFVDSPPDSSKVDPGELPSIPGSCPPGQAVCIPDGN